MDTSRGSTYDSYELTKKFNASNQNQMMEIIERTELETIIGSGSMKLFFARNVDPNPSIDTTLLIESSREFLPGSQRTSNESRWDWGPQVWDNFTSGPEYLDGRREDRREQMPMTSNSTYTLIPPEMKDDTTQLPFWPRIDADFSQFDDKVWLQSRIETTSNRGFTINGNPYNLNVRTINNQFNRSESNQFWFMDRDIGDDEVNMSGTWDFSYTANMDFTFDSANGLLIEMVTNHDYTINIDLTNSSFTAWGENAGGSKLITVHWTQDETNVLVEASIDYGRSRPNVAVGSSQLMAGDVLGYDYTGTSLMNSEMLVDIFNSTSGISVHIDDRGSKRNLQSSGDFDIDIYRHDSGHIWATNTQIGQVTGSHSEWDNGYQWDGLAGMWQNSTCPGNRCPGDDGTINYPEFKLDAWDSSSNSSYEISPHVDDRRHIDMGDDDRDQGNDGGGFNLDFPREINQTSLVVSTSLKNFNINGYPYVVEAEVRPASYRSTFTQNGVEIWLGTQPVYGTLTLTASATTRITFDSLTGVLMEYHESMEYDISLTYNQPGGGSEWGIIFDMTMDGSSDFTVTIKNHPRQFQSEQTDIPTSTSTSESSTSGTETSTTSTETSKPSTSSSSENTPDLPLPSPILPVIAGFFAIAFVYRKRN
jgi:hypothetical protein